MGERQVSLKPILLYYVRLLRSHFLLPVIIHAAISCNTLRWCWDDRTVYCDVEASAVTTRWRHTRLWILA